ncbi:MAG: hypothetical protein ACE5R3_05345 [Nitrosopumilaceae archaeon]
MGIHHIVTTMDKNVVVFVMFILGGMEQSVLVVMQSCMLDLDIQKPRKNITIMRE